MMLECVKSKAWLEGTPYIWIAAEFETARTLRRHFAEERQIKKDRYISSYWKIGDTDEGNKLAKKMDGGF